jgi:uncharacterized protein (DUF1330 family)
MEILFFTDTLSIRDMLNKNGFIVYAVSEIRLKLKDKQNKYLIYIDINSKGINLESVAALYLKQKHVFIGIIDPQNKIDNLIPIFHKGFVDYISQNEIKNGFAKERINNAISYIKKYRTDNQTAKPLIDKHQGIKYISTKNGWEDIKTGQENTFAIMFIELDDREEMEKRYGSKSLHNALHIFKKYIEKNIIAYGGKIWMWSRFGGIALFPFNATECNAVLCGFRIYLYKFLHDVEESYFPNFISFRIAAHVGNLIYQDKNKGEVIADSLNTVFHIGQNYAEPAGFYITEEIYKFTPTTLKEYFLKKGVYEKQTIFKIKSMVL